MWTSIPGTELSASAVDAQVAAGLAGPGGRNIGFGDPRKGIMDFSGGTLRRTGSEMLIFGGGGAGAWAGNDVRGLRLEDDAPRWRTRVAPTPAVHVYDRHAADRRAHTHLRNGDPNARHSYLQPQFDDVDDRFYALGCQNVWEVDHGTFNTVDSAKMDGNWAAAGTHPDLPVRRVFDGSWTARHPRARVFYASGDHAIASFEPAENRWRVVYRGAQAGIERGVAAIDPARNRLWRVGGGRQGVLVLDLANGRLGAASLAGPDASAIRGDASAGMAWDDGLLAFVYFQDDERLYAMRPDADTLVVERLPVDGPAPKRAASTVHSGGSCAIWGRMQYVPALSGVCILQRYDTPAWFVRTRKG